MVTRKAAGQIGIVVLLVLGAMSLSYFLFTKISPPLTTPERVQRFLSDSGVPTIGQKNEYMTEPKNLEVLKTLSIEPSGELLEFGCQTDGVTPACYGTVDVKNWDEFADVVREKVFQPIKEAGLDPCQIDVAISVKSPKLYKSYDPLKDPSFVDCKQK